MAVGLFAAKAEPSDHPARKIWAVVGGLNLKGFEQETPSATTGLA